ncbi:uncharacterized protein LOC131634019 [Vicia villosa]|uniref:uncharacterized protein LOC131634019 n=1 Tax=Vicia villosa TaxID=3911 RepID=UPI00273BE960|nr:uncharacterized protein LOC131634019 [Vicia villosa]XP_058760670.1 uncharacterized protein LOC131634019 [Vicia villosa]
MMSWLRLILGKEHQHDFQTCLGLLDLDMKKEGSSLHGWTKMCLKKKSEKAKQRRASERQAANHRTESISIVDHADRLVVAKIRTPLMQELQERTYRERDGEYCDDRARDTQAEYQRLKVEILAKHPELGGPQGRHPLDPAID